MCILLVIMMGRNHKIIGIASGFSYASFANYDPVYIGIAAIFGGVGAMIPDIDHHNSKITNKFILFKFLSFFLKHRGPTHSLMIILLLVWGSVKYNALTYHGVNISPAIWGFSVGYISHIFADMLTKSGVMFLWPITIRFGFPLIVTNSKIEFPLTILISTLLSFSPYTDLIVGAYNKII